MKRLWTEQMTIEVFNLFCQEPSVSWNEEVPSSVSTYNYRDALNLSLNSGKSLWKYNVAIRLSFATFDRMILLTRGLSAFISQKSNTKKSQWAWEFFHIYRHGNFHAYFLCRKLHGNFLEPWHALRMKVHRTKLATREIMSHANLSHYLAFFSCVTSGRNNAVLNYFFSHVVHAS